IGEDVDLCLRAGAAGFALSRCREAVVEHAAETEPRPVLRRSFEQAYAIHDLHCRHGLQPGRYWRNPGPAVRGDWALRRFGIDPDGALHVDTDMGPLAQPQPGQPLFDRVDGHLQLGLTERGYDNSPNGLGQAASGAQEAAFVRGIGGTLMRVPVAWGYAEPE